MTSPQPAAHKPHRPAFPTRRTHSEAKRIGTLLSKEAIGGGLLVFMAAAGIVWANTPWAANYFALRDFSVGIEAWGLDLSLGSWAADGLLAIFFFLVGLELKREFVTGDLRRFSTAVVPVAAAVGGVIVPSLIYVAVVGADAELLRGWAIPTATDIAFAVAVLAVIGSHLPSQLRIFLLTLAVIDDLIAISIIAVFYTDAIRVSPLLWALGAVAVYAGLAHRYRQYFRLRASAAWLILLPIGIVVWALVHASGIHATIAGVILGFAVPVRQDSTERQAGEGPGLAEIFEHRFRPLSAGLAVPIFAFFSAGVAIGGFEGLWSALAAPVTIGILIALVAGKPVGILAMTWLSTRVRGIRLAPELKWIDLIGVGLLAGIGFTVSLLITELSFDPTTSANDHAKVAILIASVVAAGLATALLRIRERRYRKIAEAELVDADGDGIPDVYQT